MCAPTHTQYTYILFFTSSNTTILSFFFQVTAYKYFALLLCICQLMADLGFYNVLFIINSSFNFLIRFCLYDISFSDFSLKFDLFLNFIPDILILPAYIMHS